MHKIEVNRESLLQDIEKERIYYNNKANAETDEEKRRYFRGIVEGLDQAVILILANSKLIGYKNLKAGESDND